MGAQLIKGYSLSGDSIGVAGLNKIWKLYKGKKQNTNAPATIFLIEKKQLKKADKQQFIKCAKKQASNLLRVRYPGILAVVQPLTEDDNILAFVTERIDGNIAQLIKQNKFTQFIASQLELKLYLYPFLQTIAFIHESLKQAHLAISLQNIYLSPEGKWKLAGFGVNQLLTVQQNQITQQKFYDFSFSAPQLALNKQYSKKSDIFSIGLIIIRLLQYIHKQYRPIQINNKQQYEKSIDLFKKAAKSPIIKKCGNSADLQALIEGILSWQSGQRWEISQILSSKWMNDSTLITVKYLDKISSYENKQQLQFLKGLAGVLNDFDARVVSKIILPKLIDLLKFSHLIASIVFIVIDLLKKNKISGGQFLKMVWPVLKTVTQGKQMTAQAIYLFIYNQQTLEKYIGEADNITYVLPLYIKCFDCPPKLKQLALRNLQRLSKKLDYQIFKTRILPKLVAILKDPSIDIRKDSLRGLYSIIRVIDVQTMALSILPAIQSARKAGSDPFVNAIINHIYNILNTTLPSDILSSKILPVLIPYLSDPSINKEQFQQFKNTIFNMIKKIQKDREKSFDNGMINEQIKFTENDFKFAKQQEIKSEDKGNYNFLSNYIQKKEKPNQEIDTNPIKSQNHDKVQVNHNQFNIQNRGILQNNQNAKMPQTKINMEGLNQPINQLHNHKSVITQSINNPSSKFSDQQNHFSSINTPIQPIITPKKLVSQATSIQFDFNALNNFGLTPSSQIKKQVNTQMKPTQIKAQKEINLQNMNIKQPISSSINKKQTKPTDLVKKQSQKEAKFIGGASGPMEINRLVGPNKINPLKPPKKDPISQSPQVDNNQQKMKIQSINSNSFNFDYLSNNLTLGKQTNFSANIKMEGYDGLNKGFSSFQPKIKPIKKPNELSFQNNLNMGGKGFNIGNSFNDADNPFAQLQSNIQNHEQPSPFNLTITKSQPKSNSQGQTGDIYSYFNESSQNNANTKLQNSFDLI